ncbi:glycerol-3-phosphate acyltransferase 1 [Brachypodium distachyon]|uniref:Phospholipid/glycerol acyltransferase domain-containing protein n=1 Tax=Brachypodium distachyon TaxID=15368 RepID=I1HVA6_BRADI|nr:glycerol-3-phosphate acyltransferase 1 [Brachypodium distachyon]KQK11591.1 hypothetical protein BRADI_2g61040v3 [Brachypodium distachyon]|eukprot:XP_024314274.1 glycerol-3-phosphate acyltransferase 1 [Brachypodium distachyon]
MKGYAHRLLGLHRAVKERLVAGLLRRPSPTTTAAAMAAPVVIETTVAAAILDADALLLAGKTTPAALFPPFFLVAVEAGSFARGLLLLALYPFLHFVKLEACARAMAMVAFCGLRRDEAARIGRAVLPRHFSRSTSIPSPAPEKMTAAVSSSFPTVMVEAFLKEYVGFDAVVGREVRKAGQHYYSGFMEEDDSAEKEARFMAATKGAAEKSKSENNNRGSQQCYPKPMVFHDGRLAFTPTPARALAMYAYLPLAVFLAAVRMAIYTLLPRRLINPAAALAGVRVIVTSSGNNTTSTTSKTGNGGGRLYACNHRTLLDPIAIASALNKPVSAVTYSLSRVSELLSPIPLLRLTRRREEDRARMSALLARGDDVVVCPEGTTCREPYLLRFSPLFAELADEVSPVAVDEKSAVFYGTSTSPGAKCLDSVYFLMNPRPEYSVRFLQPVRTGGGKSSIEVANTVQGAIADALGFQPTAMTRKDKYLLLAGNEGVVPTKA